MNEPSTTMLVSTAPKHTRCSICNRKTGLNYFECKCNPLAKYCDDHRYGWKHECTLNHLHANQKQLVKNMTEEPKANHTSQDRSFGQAY